MKKFRKAMSVFLALLMLVSLVPMAALAEETPLYDRGKVSAGDTEYIDSLSDEQMAGIILDYCDRRIAAAAKDFADFGKSIGETLKVESIEDLLSVLQYKDALGGDFTKLDTAKLSGISRADGNLEFIYGIIDFMSDNAELLGTVFAWGEEHFDFGSVGAFIEKLDDCSVKSFYERFLTGTDLQAKLKTEVAGEMGYTAAERETLDSIVNFGILGLVSDFCSENGLLSAEGIEELNAFDLRKTDIYTLIQSFVTLLQSDNQLKLDTTLRFFLDTTLRTMLKAAFGQAPVIGESDYSADAEFRAAYPDLALLESISGGSVCFRASDGSYYLFTVSGGEITSEKSLTWADSLINFEPPVTTITDDGDFEAVYHPTSINEADYMPTVYVDGKYEAYLKDTAAEEFVSYDAIPENVQALISGNEGITLNNAFNMKTVQGEETVLDLRVTFAELEAFANAELAKNLPTMQKMADTAVSSALSMVSFIPGVTGSVTINSVTVGLSYTGYQSDDSFIVEVSCEPQIDVSFGGNVWNYAKLVGITEESIVETYIMPTVNSLITNPVATVVVENLGGDPEGLADVNALRGFLDTDFAVDLGVFDFAGNYDEFKGVIGQANRFLCDLLDMLLSDEGYAALELTRGGNEYLYDNLQSFCTNTEAILSLAREYMSEEEFADFAAQMNVSGTFASAHGFNAAMVYETDFSSVENMLVCGIRMLCDFLVKDNSGLLYDIHLIVEYLDTLDAMAIGVTNYALCKINDKLNAAEEGIFADWSFEYALLTDAELAQINTTINTVKTKEYAKDYIMRDLTELVYYAAGYGIENVLNALINDEIDTLGLDIPHVDYKLEVEKSDEWTVTLNGVLDRVIELLDGVCVDKTAIPDDASAFAKLNAILKVLPMKSLLSGTADMDVIAGYIFTDALDGNLEGLLSLFEVKEDPIAGKDPATKALINAFAYIVNIIFEDAVNSEAFEPGDFVLEQFTDAKGISKLAAGILKGMGKGKTALVPAILDIIREANTLLPFFAYCEHSRTEVIPGKASTCMTHGYTAGVRCLDCGYVTGADELPLDPDNHEHLQDVAAVSPTCTEAGHTAGVVCSCGYSTVEGLAPTGHSYSVVQQVVAPTCTADGYTVYKCASCDSTEIRDVIAAKGHHDSDGDGWCDDCGAETGSHPKKSILTVIGDFFKKIGSFFKNLFK